LKTPLQKVADKVDLVRRIHTEPRFRHQDSGISAGYHLDHASWIWCADWVPGSVGVVRFRLQFQLEMMCEARFHVSADERFELFLDDARIARGPDRSPPDHWAFGTYQVMLYPGPHTIEAEVSCWGSYAPAAQMSTQPGFIFSAQGLEQILNTGSGNWEAHRCEGIELLPPPAGVYHVIGPGFSVDMRRFGNSQMFSKAVIVENLHPNPHGLVTLHHRLYPSNLPEQLALEIILPKATAVMDGDGSERWNKKECEVRAKEWPRPGEGVKAIPAHSTVAILFDLMDYRCGYPQLEVRNGEDTVISIDWAESLVEEPTAASMTKGNRNEWAGKYFRGFGDRFVLDGQHRVLRPFWWRSGRYVRVVIQTRDNSVEILGASLEQTGYPFETPEDVVVENHALMASQPLWLHGLRNCAHEQFVDCPFYEQLSYVADARLQALCWLGMVSDTRLVSRNLELFDWSRTYDGLVAERFPSRLRQISTTYAMIYILNVRDFAWWRDEESFTRARLPGIRSLIEEVSALRSSDGLLDRLPGWSFVDWVDSWNEGVPPGGRDGSSACLDFFWILCLKAAAELERACGDTECRNRYTRLAKEHAEAAKSTYWNQERKLFQDTKYCLSFSLHAQCLAVLAGLTDGNAPDMLLNAIDNPEIAQTSMYFDFYLLDCLYQQSLTDLFSRRLERFAHFGESGLRTPPETRDPTRSDCHAWSSHPLFHLRASLLGVRPSSFGFRSVRVAPLGGWTGRRSGNVRHPKGVISVSLDNDGDRLRGWVSLPQDTTGTFEFGNAIFPLAEGVRTEIDLLLANELVPGMRRTPPQAE
jgi:hypothetical protein